MPPICFITAIIGMMDAATTSDRDDGATAFAWTIKEYTSLVLAGIIFAVRP